MNDVRERLDALRLEVATLATRYGRDAHSIQVLAVSKTKPATAVAEAAAAGQLHFGENQLQDALHKLDSPLLQGLPLTWHFIGSVQSNKTRSIAERFDWVHSIDRLKVAERLSAQRPEGRPPLQICLQVNVDRETSKSGVTPDALNELAHAVDALPRLTLRGLMAIPRPADELGEQRKPFARLRELLLECNATLGLDMDTLSMGMSQDLEAAIAEGATWIRVGTAIFGARTSAPT